VIDLSIALIEEFVVGRPITSTARTTEPEKPQAILRKRDLRFCRIVVGHLILVDERRGVGRPVETSGGNPHCRCRTGTLCMRSIAFADRFASIRPSELTSVPIRLHHEAPGGCPGSITRKR